MSRCGNIAIRNYPRWRRRNLEFVRIENSAIRSAVPKNPTLEQNIKWIGRPVTEISPLEIFPTWRWPPSWICSIRRPQKPHPRTKHEVDRITRCRDMAIRVCWGHMEPHFGEKGGRRGSAMTPLERAMVVSYRLSIVIVALSVTIRRNLRSNVSDAKINRGWVNLDPNLGVFPWSRPVMLGL